MEEPEWTNFPPIQPNLPKGDLGETLHDIETHLQAGHLYRDDDRITWAHETTHGINSRIRNESGKGSTHNGLYCLQNRAVLIKEPEGITLTDIAKAVPREVRGRVYDLYLVQQARHWNDKPLYVYDEWIAYTNGTITALEYLWSGTLKEPRLGTLHNMMEFTIYSLCLLSIVQNPDQQLKAFTTWNLDRVMSTYAQSRGEPKLYETITEKLIEDFNTHCTRIKDKCTEHFGQEWADYYLVQW